MRTPMFVTLALVTLLSAAPGFAQSLAEFPGWRLDQATPLESIDPTALEYKDFFTLTPPGARPPITVDGGTAARLLNGQANPETIYAERTASLDAKKKEEASGGSAVGWQVAESTYVPVGEESSRNPATSVTGSSSYASMGSNGVAGGTNRGAGGFGGGRAAGASGGMNASSGSGFGTANTGFSVGGGGAMSFANASPGGTSGAFNNFSGGTAARPPAYNGGTGAATSNIDTSNMTYSQMIDSANAEATKAACARMGGYAQGGFCK